MFDKLIQAQKKAEEIKNSLDKISVRSEVEGGKIKVIATANKAIISIEIDPEFLKATGREELEELLVVAVNKVLNQADQISQTEMQAATRDMMGDLGDIFGK